MPKSSSHKSHKQSKYSSKDYSDSEEDAWKIKERSSKDESSTRGHRESTSGEKRKILSQSREGKEGKDLSGHANGDAVAEYISSKRRKDKNDTIVGSDRWNGGGDERGINNDRMREKEIHKGSSLKLEKEIHKSKENSSKCESLRTESKSESKRQEDGSRSIGERKEDILASVPVEKKESKSKVESKRKYEKEYTTRKEGKESKEKNHRSENEKNGGHESKSGDAEVKLGDLDVGKKQNTKSADLLAERQSKQPRKNNDRSSLDALRNLELDKDTNKKPRKKREGSSEREKHYEGPKESEVRRSSFKTGHSKDLKYKDVKHKDGSHAGKYQEDGHSSNRWRTEKFREESDKDIKYDGENYRDVGEGDSRCKDDRHREGVDRDSRRKDEKHRDNGARDSRRKEEIYKEGMEREIRTYKYVEDRDHEDGNKDGRCADERYYEDGDREDRRRDYGYKDNGNRDYRHKAEKYQEDTERDIRYKDSKQGDGYDKEKRSRDSKYRDDHTSRDHSGDKSDPKRHRGDGYAADHHVSKSSAYDESPTHDNRSGRFRDDQCRRTSEKESYGDVKSRSSKDQRYDTEKNSTSGRRIDPGGDRRSSSKTVDVEIASGHSRRRSSPTSGCHTPRDNYRAGKQDESKFKDYSYEERSRRSMNLSQDHAGLERAPSLRSSDKLFLKGDGTHIGDLSTERCPKSDIGSSPLPVVVKPSSLNADRRQSNSRRNVDVDMPSQRSCGSLDWKDYPAREGRTSCEIGTDLHASEDLIQQVDAGTPPVSSPFAWNSHFSGSYKSMPLPPPSLLGPGEDDGKRRPNMRRRRMGEPNIGRMQRNNNAWRGGPTWPSPVANGFLSPVGFTSVMQSFHAPPMFGIRPSLDLSHHPTSYHVPDADRFAGPGRPYSPSLHGWDNSSALFGDESHILSGRPEWDLSRNISGGRGPEMSGDLWKGANRTPSMELSSYEKENNSIQSGDDALGSKSVQPPPGEQCLPQLADGADDVQLAKIVEKNVEIGAAVISSGDSGGGVEKVSGKDDALRCSVYLSKLDLSVDLAEPELFEKCVALIDADKIVTPDVDDSNILYMEGVEAKMSAPGLLSVTLFAASNDSIFKKSMSLYKRQREHMWAVFGDKPKLPSVKERNISEDTSEKLYPSDSDDMQGMVQKTEALQYDTDQSTGIVITENPKEGASDIDLDKNDEKDDKPLPQESDTKNMESEMVDGKYGPLLNSDKTSEAVMRESVNLSWIHHSPESTH